MKLVETFMEFCTRINENKKTISDYLSGKYINPKTDKPITVDEIKDFLALTKNDGHHYWFRNMSDGYSYQSYNGEIRKNDSTDLFDATIISLSSFLSSVPKDTIFQINDEGVPETTSQEIFTIATDIINFIKDKSYFSLDSNDNNELLFSTRDNGNTGSGKYGLADLKEAESLKREIIKKFPEVTVNIETVDECVQLNIKF